MATELPHNKALAFIIATRIASILSVVGSSFIVSTFVAFPFFRKPINRLVFFATLGNILTNVATLMSNSVLPTLGEPASSLCEFQGLLIQWFMVADSFWVLCMATNVFLVFFYGYDAQQLRHLEKWYFAFSYGIPCIPVIAYVVLSRTGHPVIGSATLWCWVNVDVEWMRIAFFYVPAWVTILAAITIYSVTGYRIWQKQVELRFFSRDSNQFVTVRDASDERESAGDVFSGRNTIVVTTQIECDILQQGDILRSVSPDPDCISINSFLSTQRLSRIRRPDELISGPLQNASPTRISRLPLEDVEAQLNFHHTPPSRSSYRATIIATNPPLEPMRALPTVISKPHPAAKRSLEGHAAALAYFYVAFLMFLALIVVWLPSSINRMYQFTHKDRPSFALNIVSATVLPLQGAWNAIIYIFTTRAECRRAWSMVVEKITGRYAQYQPWREVSVKEMMTSSQATRQSTVDVEMSDIFGHDMQARQIKSPKNDHVKDDDRRSK
ncbi:hypothetical protein COCC4DRAFT_125199 [Bipolaris maydis ATCC 48331]|uniref:G-protein coupled receptors family 2 profile 2 domain-containing protein n=2 Tax=Cochliobolus heterostrophus TaxID=5016 RepID=M2UQ10_COCH5|nr:uncharacterized protein COCC4DRAFT_125199 [Bipolaris maydis ATCC 48331]EMD90018.1 hypothetical protein COCHEDRAFT_1178266 [Bipolaris maydis C5]KAH7563151.1 hypothetical protein BM1_00198 [Bipolaris maydis]ENI09768.1 hypothetical protein COCC4DRAFT_125199 [Bipolaris maydis ATCC 48331]KAJ5025309.1 hypothetical protein J3E73DRAFT_382432 [Bipolaris maydis]KAJ5063901.1 G protein coupled receptor family protein [Bipolaris maydis]